MLSSSMEPLKFRAYELRLTPFHSGLVLYGIYVLALATLYAALCWRLLLRGGFRDEAQIQFILATLILYLAQVNLGFNVFLTGTHERYLYHCFPFLILAAFYFLEHGRLLSWRSVLFFLAVATVYGGFVYVKLGPLPGLMFPVSSHEFVATVHLLLLIYLFAFSFTLVRTARTLNCQLDYTGESLPAWR